MCKEREKKKKEVEEKESDDFENMPGLLGFPSCMTTQMSLRHLMAFR